MRGERGKERDFGVWGVGFGIFGLDDLREYEMMMVFLTCGLRFFVVNVLSSPR